MAKAIKLPSGNWRVSLYLGRKDGKDIRRSVIGKSKKEAEQKAAQYLAENHLDDTPMSVGDAVDKYIKDVSSTLSPSTIKGYRSIQAHSIDEISPYMADKLTRDDLQQWVNSLSKRYSAKSTKNIYSLVTAAIRAIRPNFSPSVKLPAPDARMIVIPTDDDIKNMLAKADDLTRRAIMLAAFCSLRRGEISFLRYKDISNGCVMVHGDMVQDENGDWIEKTHAKTDKSNRIIRMPDFVADEIGSGEQNEHVVPITPTTISSKFRNLMRKMKLPYNFHLLRHYFASSLIAQGVPKAYIQALGGWESGGSLDRVYTHILQTSQNEYNEQMNNLFSSKFKG